jgi:hypothetical protein
MMILRAPIFGTMRRAIPSECKAVVLDLWLFNLGLRSQTSKLTVRLSKGDSIFCVGFVLRNLQFPWTLFDPQFILLLRWLIRIKILGWTQDVTFLNNQSLLTNLIVYVLCLDLLILKIQWIGFLPCSFLSFEKSSYFEDTSVYFMFEQG